MLKISSKQFNLTKTDCTIIKFAKKYIETIKRVSSDFRSRFRVKEA
jgi:hypothetical protein